MSDTQMTVPTGIFEVRRPYASPSSPLRAWSAADQLVLDELGTEQLGRLLIVNDEFGALTVALADAEPVVWTDSALSRQAMQENLAANGGVPVPDEQVVPGHLAPTGMFDTIVIRVPKTAALLESQLMALRSCVTVDTKVIGAAMVRHIHTSTLDLFEMNLGATTTSLAKRKARLIRVQVGSAAITPNLPLGASAPVSSFVTADGVKVVERAGTFSAGHLDVGTALLLQVLASTKPPVAEATVLDLGCGNGVIAATMAARWPDAQFILLDVSDLAAAAAELTMQENGVQGRCHVRAADGCAEVADGSIDVVVTNPPFHQGHAVDRDLTDRLLADAARVLAPHGVAYVVVQRHLKLHATMARWFDSVEVISKHPSHVVLEARTPR